MRWSTDHVDQLMTMWGGQFSAAQIGRMLGFSRNAVIGRAHRMGLPTVPKRGRPAQSRSPVKPKGASRFRQAVAKPLNFVREDFRSPGLPLLLSLMQITDKQCHFYFGDPKQSGSGYCGHPTNRGAYCGFHHGIMYRPPDLRTLRAA